MADTLGNRISTLRRQKGLTQDQLAEAMGVSAQAVSKWENDISCPDIAMLPQLADHFQVSVDLLLRGEEKSSTPHVVPESMRKPFDQLLMHIQVTSPGENGGADRINVKIPLTMLQLCLDRDWLNIGRLSFNSNSGSLKGISFESIFEMAQQGVIGKLVEINSTEGEHVEITIE